MQYGFATAGRIVAGRGATASVGKFLSEKGWKQVLVCTDRGILAAGLTEALEGSLRSAGIGYEVYSGVIPEPPVENIQEIADTVRGRLFDAVIGIGGGSSLDAAKITAAAAGNDAPVRDFVGIERIELPGLPTVLIPTTAGTGSEVTPNAIVTLTDERRKAGIVSSRLFASLAVLDPELTVGLPPAQTAAMGVDALIHSLESYIGRKANPLSDAFAFAGLREIVSSIRTVYEHGDDVGARERMLLGSMYGGMALTSAGTAAVHALAYSIGARYGIPHGLANSMLLVPVLEYSADGCRGRLAELAAVFGIGASGSDSAQADAVLGYLRKLVEDLGLSLTLGSFGGTRADVDDLALAAAGVTRLLDNNPKPMPVEAIAEIFRNLM